MKAIKIIDPVAPIIFRADDSKDYFIDTNNSEVIEAVRGESDNYSLRLLEDFELLDWANDNQNRWELDVE